MYYLVAAAVLFVIWFMFVAVGLVWTKAKDTEEVFAGEVFEAQLRQTWKVLTLPWAVSKRIKARR